MATNHEQSRKSAPGLPVDSQGNSIVDPTANVRELVEAAISRQDDLRRASEKYMEAEGRHLKEMADLRAEYSKLIREIDTVRAEKVREVDVLGGRTEAERAQAAIKALAEVSTTTAETLRKTVETTASTLAGQLESKYAESNKRISALELAIGDVKGKQTFSDPMMSQMVEKLELLTNRMTLSTGKGEGMDKMWAIIIGVLGSGAGGILGFLGAHLSK